MVVGIVWGYVAVAHHLGLAFFGLILSAIVWGNLSEELFGRVNDDDEGTYGLLPALAAAVASGAVTYCLRRAFGMEGWGYEPDKPSVRPTSGDGDGNGNGD